VMLYSVAADTNKDKHKAACLSYRLQFTIVQYTTLHYTTLHYTTLHFKANRHCSLPAEKIIFIFVQRDKKVHKHQYYAEMAADKKGSSVIYEFRLRRQQSPLVIV
jgi:hypothetical protein